MTKKASFALILLAIALSNVGGCNLFSEVSDKTSDNAVIDDVNNLIDRGLWNDAVLKWYTLSSAGQNRRDAKLVLATAYAGRGGLDLINLVVALNNNASSGSQTLFQFLVTAFKGSKINSFWDELRAEGIM